MATGHKNSRFSKRIIDLVGKGIVSDSPPDDTKPFALAVKDQLLVRGSVTQAHLTSLLASLTPPISPPKHQGNVFGSPVAGADDIAIYEVGIPATFANNVFSVVDQLRSSLHASGATVQELDQISPNHLLVPASEAGFCPWGPPIPHPPPHGITSALPPAQHPVVPVTVIDVGYQWNPAWTPNPLGERVTQPVSEVGAPDVTDWTTAPGPNTSPETVTPGGPLVALAGHANFVAGIIAQTCEHTQITIVNLNGEYGEEAVDMLPTEVSLARAILASAKNARVINVSLACVVHADPVTNTPIPAPVWSGVFKKLATEDVVVVAPVGNQSSITQRFPAALGVGGIFLKAGQPYQDEWPSNQYPQMIGVGSSTSATAPDGAVVAYSNVGQWVTSSCDGSNVVSTFLDVCQELEDDEPGSPARDFTATGGWASWSGTCFASAQMTGLIASEIAKAKIAHHPSRAIEVWNRTSDELGAVDQNNLLGLVMPI